MNEMIQLHSRAEWTSVLMSLLVLFGSVELAACSPYYGDHRGNVMSGLLYDPERPPPQIEGADRKTPVVPASRLSMNENPSSREWQNAFHGNDAISIPNHPNIKRYVQYYRHGKGHDGLSQALERAWPYIPIMSEILKSQGVPPEMLSVALVESSFRNCRASRGNPAGLWQMMPSTARKLGLRVDRKTDERLDPIKSTEAAARHLRELHDQFESWPLALAAYNAGAGKITRALKGRCPRDLGEIYALKPIPSLTREYISKVMAVIVVARNNLL